MSRTSSSTFLIIIISITIQVAVGLLPDTMGDLISYRDWCRAIIREGFVSAYLDSSELQQRGTEIIYPPLIPLLYWAIGHILVAYNQTAFFTNNYFLESFLKLIPIIFNILILLVVLREYRGNTTGKIIFAAICAYAFNPGIIFNTSYWGQTDSISSFLIVLALYLLNRGNKPELSAALSAVAVMAKPTVWPIALLIGVAIFRRNNLRTFGMSAGVAAVTVIILLFPFLMAGRVVDVMRAIVVQIDASPYVSANAHNLWWILQGGLPMIHVDSIFWGPLSYKAFGILLSVTFITFTLWKFWNSDSDHALYFAAASLAFGFYMLSTHMHENHLFGFFPIFALIAFRATRFKTLFYLLSIVFLANLLLHDPYLNHAFGKYVPGVKSNLPFETMDNSPIAKTFEEEGKSYVLLERSGKITLVGFFLTFINAVIAMVVFLYWLIAFYRSRNFDFKVEEKKLPAVPLRGFVSAVCLIVAIALFQFVTKAMRYF